MCTAYQFGPTATSRCYASKLVGLENSLRLLRPTNQAPVLLDADEVVSMRWGFARPWSKAIVNSRDDKLSTRVWSTAFELRRCLIPMVAYYEWSGDPGKKITHRFTPNNADHFWAAGIWEESKEHGLCFSMITCSPNALVEPVHDRMPALLHPTQLDAYLSGQIQTFAPSPSLLHLESPAPNPLTRKPTQEEPPTTPLWQQDELF
jgi:putative SOS response-associated peptidase YedK